MTAPHIVDSDDGVGYPGGGLTRLSTGVSDCLCMGFVGLAARGTTHVTGPVV
ncbi:hypothetical protein ACFFX0_33055 [Citricoccus parietis]|uniref:Uncharacterized protein n=1 Tax=Citricoccus parietis TaxID=592307 RepID=A0ABV5G9V2_9MICC